MEDVRLSIRDLDKSYNVPVLKGLDLSLRRGEIRALVGENGAGKSTLVNILAGLTPFEAGSIDIDGQPYEPQTASDGFAAGVSFTSQELSIVETLTVAENLFLRDLPRHFGVVDKAALHGSARTALDRVGLQHVEPEQKAVALSLAERQLLEFAKAINTDCRLLLLDEPTAALTAQQAERLHAVVSELAAEGVSVVYISHRLDDVLAVCDTVTVLRDGAMVATLETGATTSADLVSRMTGGAVTSAGEGLLPGEVGRPALVLDGLGTAELPGPIDLSCHEHEIVGIAGLAGAGKSELLRAMFCLDLPTTGRVVRHTSVTRLSSSRNRAMLFATALPISAKVARRWVSFTARAC